MRFDSSARFKRTLPALKHGGYAATIVLPGEDPAEFGQLHRELIAEIGPNGVLEEDIVATMAALLWRKQNLGTLRIAQLARSRLEDIEMEQFGEVRPAIKEESDRHKEKVIRAIQDVAQKELGDTYKLAEIGEAASFHGLMSELNVQEHLDRLVERCLKRLLLLRGFKSMSPASSSKKPAPIAAPAITPEPPQ